MIFWRRLAIGKSYLGDKKGWIVNIQGAYSVQSAIFRNENALKNMIFWKRLAIGKSYLGDKKGWIVNIQGTQCTTTRALQSTVVSNHSDGNSMSAQAAQS